MEIARLSYQRYLAAIHVKGLTEQARRGSLEKDVQKFSMIAKRHKNISELLIFRLSDLLIVIGQRLKTGAQTV